MPALLRPRRFTEKMQWRKLFELEPCFSVISDKLAPRSSSRSTLVRDRSPQPSASRGEGVVARQAFLTFQNRICGHFTISVTFDRYPVGWNHCPIGMNGTSWNAVSWICSQIFFCAARSGASNQAARSSSSFGSVGQPNQAFAPLPRNGKCPPGLATVRPVQEVQNTFQPPLSGGSLLARRVTSVPQSVAW